MSERTCPACGGIGSRKNPMYGHAPVAPSSKCVECDGMGKVQDYKARAAAAETMVEELESRESALWACVLDILRRWRGPSGQWYRLAETQDLPALCAALGVEVGDE